MSLRIRPCKVLHTYLHRLRSSGWNGSAVEVASGWSLPHHRLAKRLRSFSWRLSEGEGPRPCCAAVLSPWLSCSGLCCPGLCRPGLLEAEYIVPVLLSSFGRQGCLTVRLVQRWSIWIVLPAGHVSGSISMMRSSQTQLTSPSESTKKLTALQTEIWFAR
jgi:hypothetical protein